MSEYTEIECVVLKQTARAVLIDMGFDDPIWVPKTAFDPVIEWLDIEDDDAAELDIRESVAIEKGLV